MQRSLIVAVCWLCRRRYIFSLARLSRSQSHMRYNSEWYQTLISWSIDQRLVNIGNKSNVAMFMFSTTINCRLMNRHEFDHIAASIYHDQLTIRHPVCSIITRWAIGISDAVTATSIYSTRIKTALIVANWPVIKRFASNHHMIQFGYNHYVFSA